MRDWGAFDLSRAVTASEDEEARLHKAEWRGGRDEAAADIERDLRSER